MGKDFVTESPEDLFGAAQIDIINIDEIIEGKKHPLEMKYNLICFHATEAAEKLLKGYIRNYDININIRKIHNLNYLNDKIIEFDNYFKNIKNIVTILTLILLGQNIFQREKLKNMK